LVEAQLGRHILPLCGKRPVNEITRADVRAILAKAQQVAPVGVNRVLAAMRRMFAWAVEQDILEASPVDHVNALAKATQRDGVLTDDELARISHTAEASCGKFDG
jgi:site-specific recombinase XerD